jgi:hypothetical protein
MLAESLAVVRSCGGMPARLVGVRRYVIPGDVSLWVSGGRWGPRRARVGQCAATLAAELVYHQMICEGENFGPGWRATLAWTAAGADAAWRIEAEVLANAVWRRGRLFFRCPSCRRRATRLYIPIVGHEPRCRRCWGLSYESQSWSYKATGFLAALGPIAHVTTAVRREERRKAARVRYAARKAADHETG